MKKRKRDRNTRLMVFGVVVVVLVLAFVFYYVSAPVIDRTDWIQQGIEQFKNPNEFWMNEASWDPSIYSKESKTQELSLDLPENSSLSITASTTNVIIQSGDTNRAVLHVYRVGARNILPYKLQLEMDETQKNAYHLQVKEPATAPSVAVLEVFVTHNVLSSLAMDITNAGAKVIGLTLNNLQINSGSSQNSSHVYIANTTLLHNPKLEIFGLLFMERVSVDDVLQLAVADSDGYLEPLAHAGEALSKGIYLDACSAKEIRLRAVSDHIVTRQLNADKVHIETTAGGVSVTQSTCPYDIRTQSGDITLYMPQDSNFRLLLDVPTGHLINAFTADIREDITYKDSTLTVGNGQVSIQTESTSGMVNLHVLNTAAGD